MARTPDKTRDSISDRLPSGPGEVPAVSIAAIGQERAALLRHLGNRIRKLRRRLRWSRERLSREAQVETSILEGIELGTCDPCILDVIKIASKLGVSLTSLLAE